MRATALLSTALVLLACVPFASASETIPVEVRVREGEDTPLRDLPVRIGANLTRTDDAGIARFQLTPGKHLAYVAGDNSYLHPFDVAPGMARIEMQFAKVIGEVGTQYWLQTPGNDARDGRYVAPGEYELRAQAPTSGLVFVPRLTLRPGDVVDLAAEPIEDRGTLVVAPRNVAGAEHRIVLDGGGVALDETATRVVAWLPPGGYDVLARPLGPAREDAPSVNDERVRVDVAAGATRTVDPAYGLVRIHATRPNATGIAGALVTLENGMSARTDASGVASFVARAASYRVTIDHDVDDETRTTVAPGSVASVRFAYGEIRVHEHVGAADARSADGAGHAVTSTMDASGRASLVVPAGMYDVALRNATATAVFRGVIVPEGEIVYMPRDRIPEPAGTAWVPVTAPQAEFRAPPTTTTPGAPVPSSPTAGAIPSSNVPTGAALGAQREPQDETPGVPTLVAVAALALVALAFRRARRRD